MTIALASSGLAQASTSRPVANQLVLDNGLQLAWEEDHRQPLVAIEARIKGGLRGEGRYVGTGITHFIEHMLFKGTPTRPPGTIEQEVRRYGGTINAFTSFDSTGVTLFVESRYLREGLAMLADILQHAVFDQAEFDKERAVVISEIRMNKDDPGRRIYELLWGRHFLEHPYRHPILGYQPLLERLTTNDLTSFYAAQYQPQHITVACAGDLDGRTFPALAKELFGGWPRGMTDPSQQLVPSEPPAVSAKETSLELPVQTAYVMLGFSSTRLADPALYSLDVLASILGEGESSRLYETIVRQKQLAYAITSWNYTPYDPGLFVIQYQTDPEKLSSAKEAVLAILEDVTQRGVTDAELRKAKRGVRANYIFNLQTVEARAADIANSMASTGDPLFSRHYVDGIEQVTREQVQAVARQFLDPSKMTTAVIRPPAAAAPPPAAPSAAPGRIPVTKRVLENGLTTLIGIDSTLPIVGIVAAFRGGVRVETDKTQGLSNLVAQLLTKGTSRKRALDIATQVESLGGTLEPFSGRDGFGLSLQLLSENLEEGVALIQELTTQSTFPEGEVAIQRELIAKQIQSQDDEIFNVGGRLLRRTLFGNHPYRFNPLGEQDTIGTLTRDECLQFAKQWIVPSNMVVAVFGDANPTGVEGQLVRLFGSLPSRPSAWPSRLPEDALEGVRESSQTMEREQALVMLGFRGSTHTAEDRVALDVMTAILSGMSGRLFQAVREQQGLAYTLGAVHVPGWDPGYLLIYAATRPDEQPKVLEALDTQLELAVDKGFTEDEVAQAKRYLIGLHRMDLQHVVGLTKRAVLDELYGRGYDAWTMYEDTVNAITVPMVNEAAKRYLTMRQRAQVIVSPNGHAPTSP